MTTPTTVIRLGAPKDEGAIDSMAQNMAQNAKAFIDAVTNGMQTLAAYTADEWASLWAGAVPAASADQATQDAYAALVTEKKAKFTAHLAGYAGLATALTTMTTLTNGDGTPNTAVIAYLSYIHKTRGAI